MEEILQYKQRTSDFRSYVFFFRMRVFPKIPTFPTDSLSAERGDLGKRGYGSYGYPASLGIM